MKRKIILCLCSNWSETFYCSSNNKTLEEAGALKYTTIVAATPDSAHYNFWLLIQDAQLENILEITECMP